MWASIHYELGPSRLHVSVPWSPLPTISSVITPCYRYYERLEYVLCREAALHVLSSLVLMQVTRRTTTCCTAPEARAPKDWSRRPALMPISSLSYRLKALNPGLVALLAVGKEADGEMLTTFSSNDRFDVGGVLIAMGTPNQLNSLAEFVASEGPADPAVEIEHEPARSPRSLRTGH